MKYVQALAALRESKHLLLRQFRRGRTDGPLIAFVDATRPEGQLQVCVHKRSRERAAVLIYSLLESTRAYRPRSPRQAATQALGGMESTLV